MVMEVDVKDAFFMSSADVSASWSVCDPCVLGLTSSVFGLRVRAVGTLFRG